MQRVVNSGREDGVQFADWKWRANTVKGGWMGLWTVRQAAQGGQQLDEWCVRLLQQRCAH